MHPTFKVKSRKLIQSTYPPITKTVDTAKDLIDINLPDAFPGYRYELNPSSVHCATFLRLINDAFYMYRKLIESHRLSGNIIGWDDIKLRHRRAKFRSKHRQKGFPALVVVRVGSIDKLHDNINDALTNKNAIVLIHCDKNTPDSSYYTLIWHPDAPEYTLTNMMAFLIRVYDNSVIFKIPAMNNVKETSERFVKELGGITGNLCNPTKSKNHNVVWAVART
ncbi:hypothetical protein IWQ62_001639 [Dispira parvispora]|uniref:Uncharacterized protein n=1 Tax=Dispira parvispora TaxID=1520584 RepID=A0A9W8AUJ5_9FUNG|nr:hypothetical protein IWQ62_001639 [Dispira parvispora]